MYEVNRSVVILKPKQPFADWLASLPIEWDECAPSLLALREDCNVFLVPPAEDLADARAYVRQFWRELFEGELADWCEDDQLWPEKLTPNIFQQWFDIEIHSVVTDLPDEALEREPFEAFDLPETSA